jgi:predicted lipid-binding transport protein (Tim44 family)
MLQVTLMTSETLKSVSARPSPARLPLSSVHIMGGLLAGILFGIIVAGGTFDAGIANFLSRVDSLFVLLLEVLALPLLLIALFGWTFALRDVA